MCTKKKDGMASSYQLLKNNIDFNQLEQECKKIEDYTSNITIEVFNNCPEGIIEQFAKFSMTADNDTIGLKSTLNVEDTIKGIQIQEKNKTYNKKYVNVVILIDNIIVGKLSSCGFPNGDTFLFQIYVSKEHRNKRLGELLLIKTMLEFKDDFPQLSRFRLNTHKSNLASQTTINKFNFKEI